MSKKYRNPTTGEIFILEEEDEETGHTVAKKAPPSDKTEGSAVDGAEAAEDKDPDEDTGDAEKWPFGEFKTPFDFLDKIDGKDVEKVMLGAALGIGGVLAVKGLCSFFGRD